MITWDGVCHLEIAMCCGGVCALDVHRILISTFYQFDTLHCFCVVLFIWELQKWAHGTKSEKARTVNF